MTRVSSWFLILLMTALPAFGQDAPSMLCVHDTINNFIGITWLNNHSCGGTFSSTNIYSSDDPAGPFDLLTAITDEAETNFVDETVAASTAPVYYYVETECSGGTSDPSFILSNIDPSPPELLSVSVVNGQVEITWEPGDFPDSFGTKLFRYINGGPTFIQNVPGIGTTSAIDLGADPTLGPQSYDVSTLDGCGSSGIFTNEPHSTMWLVQEGDPCDGSLSFKWSNYVGWDSIEEYRLLRNGSLAASLPANLVNNEYDYVIQPVDADLVCFVIEAVKENGLGIVSLSNEICIDFGMPELPEYIYMRNATAIAKDSVSIEWYIQDSAAANNLVLRRGTNPADINQHIDMEDIVLTPLMDTIDALVNTASRSYYYNVVARDSCGLESSSENVRTILLKVFDNLDLSNQLEWNEFEIANGVVQSYNIYRNDIGFTTPIDNVPASQLNYTDDISDLPANELGFCYKVEAIFDLDLPIGVTENGLISSSWEACVAQNSRVFVPNVFAPNGVNNEFKPVILYPNETDYRMVIVNRWGEIMFETSDPATGWNGYKDNQIVPQGVYAYVIQMTSLNGIAIEEKGTVLLLR